MSNNQIVNCAKTVSRLGLSVPIRGLSNRLTLVVGYLVRVEPNQEERLAIAAARSNGAQAALDVFVAGRLEQFVQNLGIDPFVSAYATNCTAYRRQLVEALKSEFGLALVDLTIAPGDHVLGASRIGPVTLQVKPKDSAVAIDVDFEASLGVDPTQVVRAYAKETELAGLVNTVTAAAREFLSQRIGLHELYTNANGTVRDAFERSIAHLVGQHGRLLSSTSFRCRPHDVLGRIADVQQLHVEFEYRNPSHPSTIHVNASMNLKLENAAVFANSGVKSLDEWSKTMLKQVSEEVLFKLTHQEFCQRFDNKKQELEKRMRLEASRIGYQLDHFYTITDHQLEELSRGVEVGPIEDSFVLKSSKQLKVRLKLTVGVRVLSERLNVVMDRVVRNEDVKRGMEVSVRTITASFLRKLTPEDFYVYFEVPRADNEPSHCRKLEQAIAKELGDVYGAELTDFDATPLETEVTGLYDRLRKASGRLQLVVQPTHHPAERFDVEFKVEAVLQDSWDTFQATMPELDAVGEAIKRQLETELAALGGELLINEPRQVEEFAKLRVQKGMRDIFGLSVRLILFGRLPNEWEIAAGDTIKKGFIDDTTQGQIQRAHIRALQQVDREAAMARMSASIERRQEYLSEAAQQRITGNIAEAELLEQLAQGERAEAAAILEAAQKADDEARAANKRLGYASHGMIAAGAKADRRQLLAQALKEARRELPAASKAEESREPSTAQASSLVEHHEEAILGGGSPVHRANGRDGLID